VSDSVSRKPTILIVDDDPALQKLVVLLLQRAGFETISALNATEAAQILRETPLPDLVLLDLMLPEISGIDFLKRIRQQSMYDRLPVIILSALADPNQIREGLENGADRYLTKPYLANNLIKTVQDVIRTGRTVR
jgi:two-component system phosphate regulon response regulator PhoB